MHSISLQSRFLTDNGIHRQESSQQLGNDRIVRGSYSYIGPDGQTYTVNYVADRNGYRAYGAHLPTQPDAVANIINQAQQGVLSTTGQYVPLQSSTIAPIYNRRPGLFSSSTTTPSPNHPYLTTSLLYPTSTPSPFTTASNFPFNQGFSSTTANPFHQGVTTPSPFDNGAVVNITPVPQTFVNHPNIPAASQFGQNNFGIPSGFFNNNNNNYNQQQANNYNPNGFPNNNINSAFLNPNYPQNAFQQNNGFDNPNTLNAFAANPFQQLPFNQPFGQFNGANSGASPLNSGLFGGRQHQLDVPGVQPLVANQGFNAGASFANFPPSAFDRVNNVQRG